MTALLATVFAFGALAGCTSTQTGGTPTTGAQTTSDKPTSDGSDTGLSIAKFVSAPCTILKPDQVATLGSVKAPAPGTGLLGPNCTWDGQNVIKNSSYTVNVTADKDFDDMVNNVKNDPVFTDKKLNGIRVITTDSVDGELACMSSVQVSKTDSVTVQVSASADERATKKDCPEAERVAQLIITNLKG